MQHSADILADMFIRTLTWGTRSSAMGQIFVLVRYGVRALTQTSGFRDPDSKGDSDRATMCLTCGASGRGTGSGSYKSSGRSVRGVKLRTSLNSSHHSLVILMFNDIHTGLWFSVCSGEFMQVRFLHRPF